MNQPERLNRRIGCLRHCCLYGCLTVIVCLTNFAAAENSGLKPAVRIRPIEHPPGFALQEFEHALRWTPGGEAYLREAIKDQTGGAHRRIAMFHQRLSVPPGTFLALVRNRSRHPELRALGLRMLSGDDRGPDLKLLVDLLESHSRVLRLEAVRTLQTWPRAGAVDLLVGVTVDANNELQLRAEAVLGLARHMSRDTAARRQLLRLATSDEVVLRVESLRSLRGIATTDADVRRLLSTTARKLKKAKAPFSGSNLELAEQIAMAVGQSGGEDVLRHIFAAVKRSRPTTIDHWQRTLKTGGDPQSGRRVFFHVNSVGCSKCHAVHGRGGRVASSLSAVGRSMSRKALLESILEPSKQIPPNYVTWTVVTASGKVFSGLILEKTQDHVTLGTATGTQVEIPRGQVDQLSAERISLMPANLVERLTVTEFRDLLAFLQSLR